MKLFGSIKQGSSSCLERFVGVIKIEGKDFGGKLSRPEREGAVVGVSELRGADIAAMSDNDILFLKSDNSDRVSQSELM